MRIKSVRAHEVRSYLHPIDDGGSPVYLVIPPETEFHDGASIEYNFSKNSTYELKILLEVPDKPLQPLKVQYGLAPQYGYGCAIEACKQVKNEYIQ